MTNEYGFEIPLVSEEECKLQERIEELEKENAEQKEQLTKAKEIIKNLLILKNDHYGNTKMEWRVEVTEQAEQFLKGENIILEDAQAGNSPFDADEVFNKEMKAYPEEVKKIANKSLQKNK